MNYSKTIEDFLLQYKLATEVHVGKENYVFKELFDLQHIIYPKSNKLTLEMLKIFANFGYSLKFITYKLNEDNLVIADSIKFSNRKLKGIVRKIEESSEDFSVI